MAKKLCDLCQQAEGSDMLFGVLLCEDCRDGYAKAMGGDADAAARFSNPQNFPNATKVARERIVARIAGISQRTEAPQQEKQKQQEREPSAQSADIDCKEKVESNPVATALTVIAWLIFIGGFIAGIVLGNVEVEYGTYHTETEFSFAVAFIYWCVSLISGTMFLGFAEIIKLLEAIKKK